MPDPTRDLILIVLTFFTSTLSGVVGLGGGMLLFAGMAVYFPPLTLIPLHGVVQLASNLSRAGLGWRHVDRRLALLCSAGALIGTAIGSRLVVGIPERWLQLGMALVMLYLTWGPPPRASFRVRGKWFWVGIVNGCLSMLLGATGAFLASFFNRESLRKEALITTQGACQAVIHALKVLAFVSLGFALGPYLWLLAGMIAMAFAGSWFARWISDQVPERVFRQLFNLMITVLALRMLIRLVY